MVDINEVYTVTDTNSRGFGIIKGSGKTVFVTSSVEGDVCRIKITDEGKNYLSAKTKELISSSPYRIEPDCPCYYSCGGCSLRHVSYEKENEIKRNAIISALRKFRLDHPEVGKTLFSSEFEYRNKVSFKVTKKGNVGFFEHNTNNIVPLNKFPCKNAPARFTLIASEIAEFFISSKISVEEITLRSSTDGSLSAVVYVNNLPKSFDVKSTTVFFDRLVSLSLTDRRTSKTIRSFGEGSVKIDAFGLSFTVSDGSFFQVNYEGAKYMFESIASIFNKIDFSLCADLFCGTGIWGIALAKRFPPKKFYGIDISASAINDAEANARNNRIDNIRFYKGDSSMKTEEGYPDTVIVDPPRAGLRPEMIKSIKSLSPYNIVYISCNPYTFARDAENLLKYGYSIESVTPINMFPRTEHVETIALLQRMSNTR